jgi:hypothetical protein
MAEDDNVGNMFCSSIWGTEGWGPIYEAIIGDRAYGSDLEFLLIKYYVAGKLDIYRPEKPKLSYYLKKYRHIAVGIPVEHYEFHYCDDATRRRFIVNSIMIAIAMVRSRLESRGLDINFDELENDARRASDEYLKIHHLE